MRRIGRFVYVGPFVVAFRGRGKGRMGWHYRWRYLSPVTRHFKIVFNRCDFCGKRIGRCECIW